MDHDFDGDKMVDMQERCQGPAAPHRRSWSCRRRHFLFAVLALSTLSTLLFCCSRNLEDVAPYRTSQLWMRYSASTWWTSWKSLIGDIFALPEVPFAVPPGQSPYIVAYPHPYRFILNQAKKCEEQKPFVALVVPVAPHNRQHRDIIRRTWGGQTLVSGKVVTLFFLLGLEALPHIEELLWQESAEHQDLIQSDFQDSYMNLTIKTMVMLEWLDSYCSDASYAMKIDSDMFLNVPNLIRMLSDAPKTNYMTGLVESEAAVLRDPTSKWYLPVDIYPKALYPSYALGLGYVVSLDLPRKLVEASRHVRAIYIEDVYLGLCMEYLNIPPTHPPKWGDFQVLPAPYDRCFYSRLVATTLDQNTDRVGLWKDLNQAGKSC
ncbi:beta-1,3-galactosyltransferase 1-like [Entelurus aequoreus]|uniref:beta-1,3-galactosyltransferase 1-like n=1 Tax=Entelurus aequoreus TaxID=161455 RepID=UPI002B1D960D|nr:beta-1,3-galactosyltransferase 1-like [Entelurus aequoreus]